MKDVVWALILLTAFILMWTFLRLKTRIESTKIYPNLKDQWNNGELREGELLHISPLKGVCCGVCDTRMIVKERLDAKVLTFNEVTLTMELVKPSVCPCCGEPLIYLFLHQVERIKEPTCQGTYYFRNEQK